MTGHPTNEWVTQVARNLLIDLDEQATSITFLIRDPDAEFTAAFDGGFTSEAIRIVRGPIQALRANAIMKRWISSWRRELLDQPLI